MVPKAYCHWDTLLIITENNNEDYKGIGTKWHNLIDDKLNTLASEINKKFSIGYLHDLTDIN